MEMTRSFGIATASGARKDEVMQGGCINCIDNYSSSLKGERNMKQKKKKKAKCLTSMKSR